MCSIKRVFLQLSINDPSSQCPVGVELDGGITSSNVLSINENIRHCSLSCELLKYIVNLWPIVCKITITMVTLKVSNCKQWQSLVWISKGYYRSLIPRLSDLFPRWVQHKLLSQGDRCHILRNSPNNQRQPINATNGQFWKRPCKPGKAIVRLLKGYHMEGLASNKSPPQIRWPWKMMSNWTITISSHNNLQNTMPRLELSC